MTFFKLGKPLGKVGREIVVCVAFVYKNKKPHQNPTCISNGPHLYLFHKKQIAFTSLIPDWESEMTNPKQNLSILRPRVLQILELGSMRLQSNPTVLKNQVGELFPAEVGEM